MGSRFFLFFVFCLFASLLGFQNIEAAELKTLVVVGDSLTEGYGVAKESSYPSLIENQIKKEKLLWKVINGGVSGSTSASAVSRIKWYLKSKPSLIILALGANDGLRGLDPAATKKNLQAAIDLAKENKIPVILAGMQMPPNYGADFRKKFAAVFNDLAKENQLKLVPFLLEGGAGRKELNLADGIHPNEKGHQIVFENVWKVLKPEL